MLFTVKTSLTPLVELPVQELRNLVKEIASWPTEVGEYRGRYEWGSYVLDFCKLKSDGQDERGQSS